jgi:hypothetical protein
MKKSLFVLIGCVLGPTAFGQFAGSDDFDSNSKDGSRWGPDQIRGSGTFSISDGVLRFSSPQAASISDIEWPWIVGAAPFGVNWSVQMDVNVPVIPLAPGSTAVGLGVGVSNSADARDSFAMYLENIWGDTQQELNYYNRQRTDGATTENSLASTSTAAAVRVSWDAATRRLSAWFDSDGRSSGYAWTLLKEFDAGTSWGLTGSETFNIFVRGYSEATIVDVSQNVFGDNFRVNDDSRAPISWTTNGHYYELVSGNITWPTAKADADLRVYNGLRGHLATITSAEENAFITTNFSVPEGGRFAWIGGREPADDGVWIWDSGPESGIQFANGRAATAPYFFANWGGIEPNDNNDGEDYLMLNVGSSFAGIATGQWADAIATPNPLDPVLGYVVEYESEIGPRLQIRRIDSNQVEIWFPTVVNQGYEVESMNEVPSNNWTIVGQKIIGNGFPKTITEQIVSGNRFYRVKLVSP